MIRLRHTDEGRVLLVRIIHDHDGELQRGALALTLIIPCRWFAAVAILSAIGWTAGYVVS